MTLALNDAMQRAVDAPLGVARGPETIGRALWLYLALVAAATPRGVVVRTRLRLARDLAVPEAMIDEWLARLAGAGLVTQRSPSPYLVIVLCFWPGSTTLDAAEPSEPARRSGSSQDNVPVSSNSKQTTIALSSYAGDRGQGEGELAAEIRSLVPDAEASEVERILSRYPRAIVRKAVDRVQRTPPAKIRKSRTALFRYLLAKFSEELDVRDL